MREPMNQSQRDQLIDRYMSRGMSMREEREFHALLEDDPQLRRMLEAERAVQSTLLKDRNAIPAHDLESRAHLLGLLATAGEQAGPVAGGAFASGVLVKGIIATLAAAVLVVGGARLMDRSNSEHPDPAVSSSPATGVTVPPSSPGAVAAPAAIPSTQEPSRISTPEPAALPSERAAVPSSPAPSERAPSPPPASRERSVVEESPAAPRQPVPERLADSIPSASNAPATVASPPVLIVPDTMRLDVRLNLEKLKQEEDR